MSELGEAPSAARVVAGLARRLRLDDLAVDPYPILARLREEEPVAWIEEAGMWFVTRYDDVLAVLRDPIVFRTDSPRSPIRDTFGEQMLSTEGEQQRRYKRHCAPPFNTRAVRDHAAERIEATAEALVEGFVADPAVDLRPRFASRLAVAAVAAVLGIPDDMHDVILAWYADFAAALANFGGDAAVRARAHASVEAFRATLHPLLRDAERGEGAALLATLARAAPDRLSDDEIVANSLIVLFGGIETTESTILNVIWALLRHPSALDEVRGDGALLPAAIDEAMRWEPAVQSCTRFAAHPMDLRGVRIAADDPVQCMIGGANRDPTRFADPDRFDIHRENAAQHVSFGFGRHFCLGAALARTEVEIALRVLLRRFPELRLDPGHPSAPRGYEFRAPPTLGVLLCPRGREHTR